MKHLESKELHRTIQRAMAEVSRRRASGELDQSGRFWTDEQLAAGAATGAHTKPATDRKASAA
jgi:hypothetical protein